RATRPVATPTSPRQRQSRRTSSVTSPATACSKRRSRRANVRCRVETFCDRFLAPARAHGLSFGNRLTSAVLRNRSSRQRVSQPRLRDQSREVKVALVLNKLRDGDVLDGNGVVGIGRDHRVPTPIIMGGRQESPALSSRRAPLRLCKLLH